MFRYDFAATYFTIIATYGLHNNKPKMIQEKCVNIFPDFAYTIIIINVNVYANEHCKKMKMQYVPYIRYLMEILTFARVLSTGCKILFNNAKLFYKMCDVVVRSPLFFDSLHTRIAILHTFLPDLSYKVVFNLNLWKIILEICIKSLFKDLDHPIFNGFIPHLSVLTGDPPSLSVLGAIPRSVSASA